jgi:adenylylsulfate kinase-like enzyme
VGSINVSNQVPVQENGVAIWITGLRACRKTSLGHHLLQGFALGGMPPLLLDGDLLRSEGDEMLTYSEADRSKASRTASEPALAVAHRGHWDSRWYAPTQRIDMRLAH